VDIRMDGMNGLDLQERLVADRPAFPVIFITSP
jgi:FixJ family two-component response regulator